MGSPGMSPTTATECLGLQHETLEKRKGEKNQRISFLSLSLRSPLPVSQARTRFRLDFSLFMSMTLLCSGCKIYRGENQ